MINFFTTNILSACADLKRIAIMIILVMVSSVGFAQLFTQSSTQVSAQGPALGTALAGTPAANVIFSSAGKVNGGFDAGNLACTNGYAGFTSAVGINSYSTTGPAVEITLSPASSFVLSTTGVSAKLRRSTTGPANATFAYSLNGGTTWVNNTSIALPDIACQSGTTFTWSFTCPVIVSDVQTFKFRIYIYGSTGTTGTTQIENLTVNGTVTACSSLTASIAGSTTICAGANSTITFSGSPLSTVTYNINGGSNLTIPLDCTGAGTLNTGALSSTTTYNLVSVGIGTCSKSISGSAVVNISPQISAAVISGTNSICSGTNTNLSVNITGGISPYTVVYSDGSNNYTINSYISGTAIPVTPVVNTTYTLVSVNGGGGCSPSSNNTGIAVISMSSASTASTLSGTTAICTGSSASISVAVTGGVSPFTIVYFNGVSNTTLTNYLSGTGIPVSPVTTTTYSLISVTGMNSCAGTGNAGNAVVTVTAPGTWKGVNTNWNDPLNWCDGNIPTSSTNVIIPGAVPFYPIITTADPQVKNITIAPGANINITAAGVFSIAGSTINSGSITNNGTIVINGTTGPQNFPVTGSIPVMNNLTISNGSGVNMNNSLTIGGTLTLANGIYTVGGFTLTIAKPLAGTITNLSANSSSSIAIVGTAPGVNLPASISQLKNLSISNSAGTMLQGNLNISTLLLIAGAAGIVDAGSFTLNGAGGLTMTAGNLLLSKDAVVLPELAGTYNLTGGTVSFNGTGVGVNAQTIRPVNYFNLTSTSTGDRTLSSTGTIGIANNFTPSTNPYTITGSTINFTKTNNQNIPGFGYNNLTLSGGNFTKTLTGNISIEGILTFGANTKLDLVDRDITLKSGLSNTAAVAMMPTANSISYGAGRFIVERYIATGVVHAKSWQLLSVPTTTGQTVKDAWQETAAGGPSDNPRPGYGTQLTSNLSNALALGFDFYTASGSTIKTYNSALDQWDGISSTAIPIANAKGYMLFVRGDRSVTVYNQPATATIMRTKGKLYAPGVDAPAPVTVPGGKFESVGNPYASAIDLTVINSLQTGDVQNIYYVWDPQLASGPGSAYGLGGFRTLTFNGTNYDVTPAGGAYGPTAKYIQSGQAFFVKSFSAGGTINFNENCKVTGSSLVTRPVIDSLAKLRTNLRVIINQVPVLLDGAMLQISSSFSNILDKEDALKMFQTAEDISILQSGQKLSVESKNLLDQSDTIEYRLAQLKQHIYELEFIPENIHRPDLVAYLEDRFLHTKTVISQFDTTRISFEPDVNNPLSMAANRFCIVFAKSTVTSPVRFINVEASRNSENVAYVKWETDNEDGFIEYQTERSDDGINFYLIGVPVTAHGVSGINRYQLIDSTVTIAVNFYRIKAIMQNGTFLYSNICRIEALDNAAFVLVYPNPVLNNNISILFRNMPIGAYNAQLVNSLGQIIYNRQIVISNNLKETVSFNFGNKILDGTHYLRITSKYGFENVQQLLFK